MKNIHNSSFDSDIKSASFYGIINCKISYFDDTCISTYFNDSFYVLMSDLQRRKNILDFFLVLLKNRIDIIFQKLLDLFRRPANIE